ncbi:MAG: class I SAM-dependent RNA methyltransferase [Firmicutes bacterium]|nr:class I SAM-dependent RNA methyltransferase [Bacillota bacterium]
MKLELIATAAFGLEAVVRREIEALGYSVIRTEDGKITYAADERGIVRSNLWLRCADRVLVKIDEFEASDFETLFQKCMGIPWEEWIPADGKFVVTCTTVKSKLHNEPACQRTVKKAIVNRLQDFYVTENLPECGAEYPVKLTLLKDRATLTLDTSGAGLHKRGYRVADVAAPIKETLAAALVQLSFWNTGRILVDPCCGSGTIPIEAAMIGMDIAPGLNRAFLSEGWEQVPASLWKEERAEAFGRIRTDADLQIYGYDIDQRAVAAARENAIEAGVEEQIRFCRADVNRLIGSPGQAGPAGADPWHKQESVVFVTNLPYAIRIGTTEELEEIYRTLRGMMEEEPTWSLFLITADKQAEEALGRKADRRRKLYNGTIETTYYQYHGQRTRKEKTL